MFRSLHDEPLRKLESGDSSLRCCRIVARRRRRAEIDGRHIEDCRQLLQIRMFGRGAHGSMPQASIDPVVMSASTVLRLQTIVSRELAANEAAVVTLGSLQAGTKENVIPDEAIIKLNVRTFDEGVRKRVLAAIERIDRQPTLFVFRLPRIGPTRQHPTVLSIRNPFKDTFTAISERLHHKRPMQLITNFHHPQRPRHTPKASSRSPNGIQSP